MKNTEIKGLTVAELKEKIGSETENLRKIKFAHQISSIENPMTLSPGTNQILYENFPHITPNTHFKKNLSLYYSQIERSQETFPITRQ